MVDVRRWLERSVLELVTNQLDIAQFAPSSVRSPIWGQKNWLRWRRETDDLRTTSMVHFRRWLGSPALELVTHQSHADSLDLSPRSLGKGFGEDLWERVLVKTSAPSPCSRAPKRVQVSVSWRDKMRLDLSASYHNTTTRGSSRQCTDVVVAATRGYKSRHRHDPSSVCAEAIMRGEL